MTVESGGSDYTGFIIDMAFCTYNSVFENEDPKETLDDLELIRIAKEWRKRHAPLSV